MGSAVVLCGSGDQNGVTRWMCIHAAEMLSRKGLATEVFVIPGMMVGHCMDCGGCARGRCVIEDDMSVIRDAVSSADLLVLASPIHFSGPSSSIKTVMDRFQPFWHDRSLGHPRFCIGMLCGGSERPNFSNTESIFRAFCITVGMEYLGTLEVPGTDLGIPDLEDRVRSFVDALGKDMA